MPQFKKIFFAGILLVFLFAVCEGTAYLAFSLPNFQDFEKTRQIALGELPPDPAFQVMIGQANLSYIPSPNFKNKFGLQHNSQGYRGKSVPMRRTPGMLRVLCLGGSTVYGYDVQRPEEAYPAQMEKLLNENLPPSIRGIEVINGGNPYATAAEMLTHYHFKYHYYKPDLVILEAGGNDGEALARPFYQPDYSHWRQPLHLPKMLPRPTRILMKSRLISFFLIPLFYGTHPERVNLQRAKDLEPIAQWYEPAPENSNSPFNIPDEEMAMKHDLEYLIDEISKDGAKILLMPFRVKPGYQYKAPRLNEAVVLNEQILTKIAADRNLPFAPYPGETISPQNWEDDCHLNAEGEKEKAAYTAPFAKKLLLGTV